MNSVLLVLLVLALLAVPMGLLCYLVYSVLTWDPRDAWGDSYASDSGNTE